MSLALIFKPAARAELIYVAVKDDSFAVLFIFRSAWNPADLRRRLK